MKIILIILSLFVFSCQKSDLSQSKVDIYNGKRAIGNEFLSVMHIPKIGCTAVAISPKFLISAAHCFASSDWKLYKPEYWKNASILDNMGNEYKINNVTIPKIKSENIIITEGFDLAIIELSNNSIPIYAKFMPSKTEATIHLNKNEGRYDTNLNTIFIAGTGPINDKGHGYGKVHFAPVAFRGFWGVSSEQIHIGSVVNHSCGGDSGGGVFVKIEDRYFLTGIIARSATRLSHGCMDNDGSYAVFVNDGEIMNWIKKNTNS